MCNPLIKIKILKQARIRFTIILRIENCLNLDSEYNFIVMVSNGRKRRLEIEINQKIIFSLVVINNVVVKINIIIEIATITLVQKIVESISLSLDLLIERSLIAIKSKPNLIIEPKKVIITKT